MLNDAKNQFTYNYPFFDGSLQKRFQGMIVRQGTAEKLTHLTNLIIQSQSLLERKVFMPNPQMAICRSKQLRGKCQLCQRI